MNIDKFKLSTGYYDEGAILRAAGVAERAARFADIFGDVQGAHDISTEWQALLDEARRRNCEMSAVAAQSQMDEIAAALAVKDWKKLVRLGAARASYSEGEERVIYTLTSLGLEAARGGRYQNTAADYADQSGLEG